jgi:hypothetical protein
VGLNTLGILVVVVVFFLLCNEVFPLIISFLKKKSHNIWIYAYTLGQITNGMGHGVGSTIFPILVTNVVQFLVLKKNLVASIVLKM